MSDLISKLRAIQDANGLSDLKMAQLLNVSRQNYNKTKSGKIPLGNKILKGIPKAFPELQEDVKRVTDQIFLTSDANVLSNNANENTLKPSSQAQGRGLKRIFVELLGRIRK